MKNKIKFVIAKKKMRLCVIYGIKNVVRFVLRMQ